MAYNLHLIRAENNNELIEDWQPCADVEWKKIQQNTFTRWVNQHLQPSGIVVEDLETDFEEGLKLISLVEALAGRSLGKYSKRVTFRSQKLENISLALNFLENEEHIKLVNIDSSSIADRNLKLILGLVWTLILHYSISKQIWDHCPIPEAEAREVSPKQKLMAWIRAKLPTRLPFTNFTSDWNDGILLGALVDSCAPDLEVGWRDWVPSKALHSTRTAMQLANNHLGISQLITPNDLINPAVDEKSVMTYLSQFPKAKYTPPAGRVKDVSVAPIVGVPTKFFVVMHNHSAVLDLMIEGPKGSPIDFNVVKMKQGLYKISYTPMIIGEYVISAIIHDKANNTSVQIDKIVVNAVNGPKVYYNEEVLLDEFVQFFITDVGEETFEVAVVDQIGDRRKVSISNEGNLQRVFFSPSRTGLYTISLLQDDNYICNSPFTIKVLTPDDVNIWGRGICSQGIRVGDEPTFSINLNSDFEPVVKITGPGGTSVPVQELIDESAQLRIFRFSPTIVGKYLIEITSKGRQIGQSPYEITVVQETNSLAHAFGPGLKGGLANVPNFFFVEKARELDVTIDGPNKPTLQIIRHGNINETLTVHYVPTEEGIYAINIFDGKEHIKNSPFIIRIQPVNNLNLAEISAIDLKCKKIIINNKEISFRLAEYDEKMISSPKIEVLTESGEQLPLEIKKHSSGEYRCKFMRSEGGCYHILVTVNGIPVPNSPFSVILREEEIDNDIQISGSGIGPDLYVGQPATLLFQTSHSDPKQIAVDIHRNDGSRLDVNFVRYDVNKALAKFSVQREGEYEISVYYERKLVSKYLLNVRMDNICRILVDGLEDLECMEGEPRRIRLDTRGLRAKDIGAAAVIKYEDEVDECVFMECSESDPFIWTGELVPKNSGNMSIMVYFDGIFVAESKMIVNPKQNASKCRAYGVGLERAIVGKAANFTVDMRAAGDGVLTVSINGPSEPETNMVNHSNGLYTVEYFPMAVGVYEINIEFGNEKSAIPDSPFKVIADFEKDPSSILASKYSTRVQLGCSTSLFVDARYTALDQIKVRLPPEQEQAIIEEVMPRQYKVTFTPIGKIGDVIPMEIYYGDILVGDRQVIFPMLCIFAHSTEMRFLLTSGEPPVTLTNESGHELSSEIYASLPCRFLVTASNTVNASQVTAVLQGPDSKLGTIKMSSESENTRFFEFTPIFTGIYSISIHDREQMLLDKPHVFKAVAIGDASKCVIKSKPFEQFWEFGKEMQILVDAKRAGEGNVNIDVMSDKETDFEVEKADDGHFLATIVPYSLGHQRISILFGGVLMPDGIIDFECIKPGYRTITTDSEVLGILERSSEIEEPLHSPLYWRKFCISVITSDEIEDLCAFITMPSGSHDTAKILDNHDGTITVMYKPTEVGHHLLSVRHNNSDMVGSPISFYVNEAPEGYVTVYGPGLINAIVGEPAAFNICAKGNYSKEIAVAVEGAVEATIQCHDNKDGTCSVAWIPPAPGDYKIHVRLGGHDVKGSPYSVFVAGEGQKRAHLSVGSTSEVSLKISTKEIKGYSASIKSPSGIEEPCFIRQIDSSNIGVSFTPREAGEHLITVKRNGKIIPKSPFRVKVDDDQVGDATKVKMSGVGKSEAICQVFNDFLVDTSCAGYGGLSVSIEGPSKAELNCTDEKNGLIKISYRPTEPGIYIISVKFADTHVSGSPFTVNCTGKGIGAVKENSSKKINQAPIVLPGNIATVDLRLDNTSPLETTAKILDPNGHSEDGEVRDLGGNFYQVRFKPEMEGPYALSVFSRGRHIFGSPFPFTVGHFTEFGAHRVRAAGIGLLRAETNQLSLFNVYTREAGAGQLSVAIEGPSKAEIQFHDHKNANCYFNYKVSKPGDYMLSVKFNDQHIPDSPFKVFVTPTMGEARRLEIASFPDSVMPGKACTFSVLTHAAPGYLEAKVQTPSNQIETIDIVPIDEGESYALRFVPHEAGNYYVDVTLDGAPMRDSPFRIRVGDREDSDPTAITVSGDGIRAGKTGLKCEFVVNTCNAGSGNLQIQVDGPSKVTLDAYEMEQGYKVRYMALVPGVYYIAVKYSGIHIPGSPYKVVIEGKELGSGEPDTSLIKIEALAKTSTGTVAQVPVFKGDASKVVVKGAGLNKFFPGRPASFNIETGMAGENVLFVGVLTAKGPCEEVIVKHIGGGQYTVVYRIQERVKGFVFVKYGEFNVPGSPFAISF